MEESASRDSDDRVQGWLIANLPFEYYGFRERSIIVGGVLKRLMKNHPEWAGQFGLIKGALRERLAGFVERQTDRATEAAFKGLFDTK